MQSPSTVPASLAERVHWGIINGEHPPGSRLKLSGLAERYGAGLIPLREALSRLAHRGFVIPESQKGFRVAPVSRDDLLDLTRTRIDIECLALRRSVEDGDIEWETRILSAAHRLKRTEVYADEKQTRVTPAWESAHMAFHDALTSACGSPRIMDFRSSMTDHAKRYRQLSVGYSASPRQTEAEHEAIINAALNRDADELCHLMGAHFSLTAEIILSATSWDDL